MAEEKTLRESRMAARIRLKKLEFLDTLVNLFITDRSGLADPEGEEAEAVYLKYKNMWLAECKAFNKNKNRPFALRGGAFEDRINFVLEKEKAEKQKKELANIERSYKQWKRRRKWYVKLITAVWFWVISLGNKEKIAERLRKFYFDTLKDANK